MLSPEQIEKRKGKLTASRIAALMNGNAEEIMQLYLEFIGESLPENLDDNWPVQLGSATEQLNLDWFEKKQKVVILGRGQVIFHPQIPWAACTIDGWVEAAGIPKGYPVEAKHVGGREPLEIIIERYQPQMQWQMEVTGASQCALSVIMGANEPVVEFIDRDDDYIAEMIKRGKRFMVCVAARLPPVTLPPVAAPVPHDKMREVDMSGDETWCRNAQIWDQCIWRQNRQEMPRPCLKILSKTTSAKPMARASRFRAIKQAGSACERTNESVWRVSAWQRGFGVQVR